MKTLLITGATSGIGKATAILAVQKGYRVIACGRNLEALDSLAKYDNMETIAFDVTDENATKVALQDVHFDYAILNAGTCEYVNDGYIEPALFERVFATNFFGVVNCVSAIQHNINTGGQLIIVDSMARLLPFTKSQAYGASKAALHYFSKSLEVDWADRGVVVKAVSPGFVETPLTDKNNFAMPMIIKVEDAAQQILGSIERRTTSIYFPTTFGIVLRILNALPDGLKKHISIYLKNAEQK